MRLPRCLVACCAAVLLLVACEGNDPMRLKPGQSTRTDVLAALGTPAMEWTEPDGSVTLEFPKGPVGHHTWMARLDTDGVLRALDQVLTEPFFAKIANGMDKDQVRRILGRPGETRDFPLKPEEVWSWRFLDVPNEPYWFSVHFAPDGHVTGTSRSRVAQNH